MKDHTHACPHLRGKKILPAICSVWELKQQLQPYAIQIKQNIGLFNQQYHFKCITSNE